MSSNKLDYKHTYSNLVASLKQAHDYDTAMQQAVGGEFVAGGKIGKALLKHYQLKESDYVIDVGCGSGRLSIPLSKVHQGKYLGIDVIEELLDYAKKGANRSDWRFEVAEGISIPEENDVADIVLFFSVFTHLLHEETFCYLQEAKRVLKVGGRIIFSFLEFEEEAHWAVFQSNIEDLSNAGEKAQLNMFMSRAGIERWANQLDLNLVEFRDGSEKFIPIDEPIVFESGEELSGFANAWQSVCVLQK